MLWGDKEVTGANTGTITINSAGVVSGQGTNLVNDMTVGHYVRVNNVEYRIQSVSNTTSAVVVPGKTGVSTITVVASNTGFTVSSKPIWLSAASNQMAANDVYFVDQSEAQAANNTARGLSTPGWVHYNSYTDSAGNVRYKSEVLVAMKRTKAESGDAEDTVTE